jgi:ribosomal protein S25
MSSLTELMNNKPDVEKAPRVRGRRTNYNLSDESDAYKNTETKPLKKTVTTKQEPLVNTPQPIILKEDSEVEALRNEVFKLKNSARTLSKNEEKILNAIRSEILNQSKDEPIISRSMLLKKYKMNSKYMDDSIKNLIEKGFIERKKVKYSMNIYTNSWKIISN